MGKQRTKQHAVFYSSEDVDKITPIGHHDRFPGLNTFVNGVYQIHHKPKADTEPIVSPSDSLTLPVPLDSCLDACESGDPAI